MSQKNIHQNTELQEIAKTYTEKGSPLDWFEEVYQKGRAKQLDIPWADVVPNPNVKEWFDQHELSGHGKTALVIGCGLGEDAEYLASLGFDVDAFDIAPSAIAWAKDIWKDTKVNYFVADWFELPIKSYDFVLEIYTIQTLPVEWRAKAISILPQFVAPQGYLLLICRGRDEDEAYEGVPYPLTQTELSPLAHALFIASFEDYNEQENRRFRIFAQKTDFM